MLDAHTDGVNENSNHNAPAEVLALHNAPKFPPHTIPEVLTMSKACPFPLPLSISPLLQVVLLFARLLNRILFIFLAIGGISHSPHSLLQR